MPAKISEQARPVESRRKAREELKQNGRISKTVETIAFADEWS
jgi:hypothetical protein